MEMPCVGLETLHDTIKLNCVVVPRQFFTGEVSNQAEPYGEPRPECAKRLAVVFLSTNRKAKQG